MTDGGLPVDIMLMLCTACPMLINMRMSVDLSEGIQLRPSCCVYATQQRTCCWLQIEVRRLLLVRQLLASIRRKFGAVRDSEPECRRISET